MCEYALVSDYINFYNNIKCMHIWKKDEILEIPKYDTKV